MAQASHQRMVVLDGMRGVAAALVLIHHIGALIAGPALLPHGYLAVDFFFMLSGFVMTRTYEGRFRDGLGVGAFMTARLARLYPTIALGILLGAGVMLVDGRPWAITAAILAIELLFVPSFGSSDRGIFVLNGVQWSLWLELVANVAHAVVLRRLRTGALVMVAAVAVLCLAIAAARFGSLAVGDREMTIGAGIPRVFLSYTIGILAGRSSPSRDLPPMMRHGLVPVVALIALIWAIGCVPAEWGGAWPDMAAVLIGFPVLILWGARAGLSARIAPAAGAIGALSYPLYAVHVPVICLAMIVLTPSWGAGAALRIAATVMAVVAAVIVGRLVPHLHRGRLVPNRRRWRSRRPRGWNAARAETPSSLSRA